jgi:hypothetical protein
MPRPASTPTILSAMSDPSLFGPAFRGPSWQAWHAFLATLFALPMTDAQRTLAQRCTGRTVLPEHPAREAWVIAGRRGGKSRIAALVAVYLASFRDYARALAPGERGTVMLIASDRRQARTLMRYVIGLLDTVPMLGRLVEHRTADSVTLRNRITLEIHTASYRAVRGYTVVAVIADEVAFWRSEDSTNPDVEILHAIRPALATVPDALLLAISTPYARRGALWTAYQTHFGQDADPVLVWRADTATMNPLVDPAIIADAYAADPAAASAEYGAAFRTDVETFIAPEAVAACVIAGQRERSPSLGQFKYAAFTDPAGGSGQDSMTLAIAHHDRATGHAVLDALREVRPPFSPEAVVEDFAGVCATYGVRKLQGDRFAGEWAREPFRKHGLTYEVCETVKSDLYRDVLPLLNSGRVDLLDDRRLLAQLTQLERRTGPSGRDHIDHAPGGHDDVINAATGALLLAAHLPVAPAGSALSGGILGGLYRPRRDQPRPPRTPVMQPSALDRLHTFAQRRWGE